MTVAGQQEREDANAQARPVAWTHRYTLLFTAELNVECCCRTGRSANRCGHARGLGRKQQSVGPQKTFERCTLACVLNFGSFLIGRRCPPFGPPSQPHIWPFSHSLAVLLIGVFRSCSIRDRDPSSSRRGRSQTRGAGQAHWSVRSSTRQVRGAPAVQPT